MKVWVCRNIRGQYAIYREECSPSSYGLGYWYCKCTIKTPKNHVIAAMLCPDLFRQYTGIHSHLKEGTKKLMEWTLPLAGDAPAGR